MRSTSQEKTGEGHDTLPVKERSPLNELTGIVGSLASVGFDILRGAGAAPVCGQYQYGGTMPIVAPAARVSPVVREVQL